MVENLLFEEGIKDGFLTPFKVKRIQTTIDEYTYSEDDEVLSGEEEINPGETFTEQDIKNIVTEYKKLGEYKLILTTEKDYVWLKTFDYLRDIVYYW